MAPNGTHKANGGASKSDADPNWWRQACVYQIYPRSFADANGDGIGDLEGITSRVPYLEQLGVDAVWLSPFYPSALKDGGYDVSDYRDVDPKIGTLADFDVMMAAFKKAGIKVIVDIVPNHSSDDHVWFQEALRSPIGSNARNRYIFQDGLGPKKDVPPSDWTAIFGGSAWEPVGDGQFYLHMFDTSQPDLNWDHPEVRADFLTTLRFWADRGVAGFRVDVAHGLMKDLSDEMLKMPDARMRALEMNRVEGMELDVIHPLWDRDEVHDVYKEWRKVFDEYDPPMTATLTSSAVAEAWVNADRKHKFASPEGLGQSFSFDMLMCNFQRDDFRQTIETSINDAKKSGSSTTWVFSNHDSIRHATRYGLPNVPKGGGNYAFFQFFQKWLSKGGVSPKVDTELGLKRARAATLMLLALPGSTYIYQGEELGLFEVVDIKPEDRQDPTFFRNLDTGAEVGRDGCRVPIPWTRSGPNFGFGVGKPAHMPQPEWFGEHAAESLEREPDSVLNMYRLALRLRRELQGPETIEWVDDEAAAGKSETLRFRGRGGWEVLINFDGEGVEVPKGEVLVASGVLEGGKVPKNTAVWVKV